MRTWHERGCGGCYHATEEVTPLDVYYQLNRQSFQGTVDGMHDADRLRTLILRRLAGAERARAIATEHAKWPYSTDARNLAGAILEALDG